MISGFNNICHTNNAYYLKASSSSEFSDHIIAQFIFKCCNMSYDLDGKANQLFKHGKSKRQRLVNMNAKALYVHSLRQWNLSKKSATKGYLKRVYKELTSYLTVILRVESYLYCNDSNDDKPTMTAMI